MKKLLTIAALLFSAAAHADTSTCGAGDLSGVSFIKCAGYDGGNLLNNSTSSLTTVQGIFSSLGYGSQSTTWTEKLDNLGGTNTIDFTTSLSGINILGIHKGGAGSGTQSTAFYVIDAGTNVDTFKYNLSGSSTATIYSVSMTSPVPEPRTYALFLAGFLAVAWVTKRKA